MDKFKAINSSLQWFTNNKTEHIYNAFKRPVRISLSKRQLGIIFVKIMKNILDERGRGALQR